jgi:transcriptional regulator with XRE-family HTH domain
MLTGVDIMKSPNEVDDQIGDRLRSQRKALGISIESLAHAIGSTADQIERWEAGIDRVGALYLRRLSAILAVDFNYFFPSELPQHLHGGAGASRSKSLFGLAASVEDLRLIHAFANIKIAAFREAVIKLAETMAETELEPSLGFGEADGLVINRDCVSAPPNGVAPPRRPPALKDARS